MATLQMPLLPWLLLSTSPSHGVCQCLCLSVHLLLFSSSSTPPPPPKKKSSSPLPSPATGPFTDLHFPPPPPLPNTNGVAVSLAQQALEETASACTLMPQQKRCMDSMDLGVLLPSSASTTFEVWASPKTRSARAMPAFCCVLWKLPLLAFPPLP